MDTGLLLLRLVVGLLFVGHGTQKLFGWFGGHGLDGTGGFMESIGYRPGRRMAALAGGAEAGCGLLLALGFLTPFAAAGIVGVMLNASLSAHRGNGLWNTNGGYELPLVLAAAALAVAFVGPGAFSLDEALGLVLRGAAWGLGALGLGVLTGLLVYGGRSTDEPAAAEPAAEEGRRAA